MKISAINHVRQMICVLAVLFSCQLHAQTNLALNKLVTTNSENQSRNNAVDGDINTRWSSIHSDLTAWLQVDMGEVYGLTGTTIHWETANAAAYVVEGSASGTSWTTLAAYTGGTMGNRTDTLNLSGFYRYLRIKALEKSADNEWGYSIWEWEVYGTSGGSSSSSSSSGSGQVVFFEDFDNATLPTSLNISNAPGAELVSNSAETYGGQGKSLKYTYSPMGPEDSSQYPRALVNLSTYNTDHVYIRFVAKMPEYKHGLKFVKVFGQGTPSNSANTTFGLDYTGIGDGTGSMYAISFGDGSGTANDTQNVVKFNDNAHFPGRSENVGCYDVNAIGHNFSAADWGTGWHKFELYVKFNSGTSPATEVNDGEFIVKIDNVVYMDAKCLFNRHYSNGPINGVEFLGWSQVSSGSSTPAFEIWYDEIEISLNDWGNNPL